MKESKVIDQNILLSEDIIQMAKMLLGKSILSYTEDKFTSGKIVEVEAYKAPEDMASHAYKNKLTKRTKVMFGPAGIAYVYLCYGIHKMLNVVSGPEGAAHALLIRAIEPITGLEHMINRRGAPNKISLSNGPGKLCQALGIELSHNGINLTDKNEELCIVENEDIAEANIIASPRVGIAYAAECAHWPWRFRIKDNPYTSLPDKVNYP